MRSHRLVVVLVVVVVLLLLVVLHHVLGCPLPSLVVRFMAVCRAAGLGWMMLCVLVLQRKLAREVVPHGAASGPAGLLGVTPRALRRLHLLLLVLLQ